MHFAAWLLGRRVGQPTRSGTTTTTSAARSAVLGGDGRRRRAGASSSRPRAATFGEPRARADRRGRTRSGRSTPTARPSWRSSGRCRTSSAPTASARWCCATSTPPAPIRTACIGEDHRPEIHLIPRAIDAVLGRRAARDLRRRLPDARRHLPARLRPRHRPGRRAPAARSAHARRAAAPSRAYNLGIGRPFSVREVLDAVERWPASRCRTRSGPRRPGDPAVLYAVGRSHPPRARLDARVTPISGRIVDTAWQWRRRHPDGYAGGEAARSSA